MARRLKSWFFQITSVTRDDGTVGGIRFRKKDKPTTGTMQDLTDSSAFPTESGDRAKLYNGDSIELGTEQGLVVLATDAQAKSNQSQLTDRSLVAQPHQLPTIQTIDRPGADVFKDMPLQSIESVADPSTTTRNNYLTRIAPDWLVWLMSVVFKQGGSASYVPIKNSSTNYDWSWGDLSQNSTFINNLTSNTQFATALQTTITNLLSTNPTVIIDGLPVGSVMSMGVTGSLGSKWLLCDGSAVSRTTYPELFAALNALGLPFGNGNGSTTFNIPDLREKNISGTGLSYNLGNSGGNNSITLNTNQLPSHNHTASASSDPGHIHDMFMRVDNSGGSSSVESIFGTPDNGDNFNLKKTIFPDASTFGGSFLTPGINTNQDTIQFQWDGATNPILGLARAGQHTHSITVDNTGTGSSIDNRDKFLALALYIKVTP